MRAIVLSQGKITLVSDRDYSSLRKYRWYALKSKNTYYAIRTDRQDGRRKTVYMHRVIKSAPYDKVIDHKDGNGLNNRRNNLRICDQSTNMHNQSRLGKGINFHPGRRKPYQARICIQGVQKSLGYYTSEQEASQVYKNHKSKLAPRTQA